MATMPMLTIDASTLDGFNFSTYIADEFAGLGAGTNTFWGGTPVSAFGGTYYVNGTQVLANYGDASGAGVSPTVALIEGENLAYDYLNYGSSYGHGISGTVESLTFGEWVAGQTTGTQGTGPSGAVTGLDTGLTISGFDLTAAPGSGFVAASNPVYGLYNALATKNAAAIYDLISKYSMDLTGSAGNDTVLGSAGGDRIFGFGGNDTLDGGAGFDRVGGGVGTDTLFGRAGNDIMWGGDDADLLNGGAGADRLNGGAGSDKLIGGAGADTFIFVPGTGADKIFDFSTAEDVIDLRGFQLSGFDAVAMTETTNGASLAVEDISILVRGVEVADLGADQFLI